MNDHDSFSRTELAGLDTSQLVDRLRRVERENLEFRAQLDSLRVRLNRLELGGAAELRGDSPPTAARAWRSTWEEF
jgi:hypothetical protein